MKLLFLSAAKLQASEELRAPLLTEWGLGGHGERWCQQTIRQPGSRNGTATMCCEWQPSPSPICLRRC